jgi:hypothetical protein
MCTSKNAFARINKLYRNVEAVHLGFLHVDYFSFERVIALELV